MIDPLYYEQYTDNQVFNLMVAALRHCRPS